MTRGMIARQLKRRLSDKEALERHKQLMQDPKYAEAWNRLTSQLRTFLADLPEEALPDSHEQDDVAR